MTVILELNTVTKRFGGLEAVSNFSLNVNKGEIVGLIGPNGAGKTTLVNIISGMYRPTSGTIKFDGLNITKLPPHKICRLGISRTFQIVRIFPELNVLDHVMVGAMASKRDASVDAAKSRAENALKIVGLIKKKDALARNLTLVEKKLLVLASALATEPKLLLCDEVVSGMNPKEIDEAIDIFKEINKLGITLMIIEHVMRFVMRISERVIVMHLGKKIAEGTPTEVAKNKEVAEVYLGEGAFTAGSG